MICADIINEIHRKRHAVLDATGKEPEIVVYLDHLALAEVRREIQWESMSRFAMPAPKLRGGTISGYKWHLVDSIHHGWKVYAA